MLSTTAMVRPPGFTVSCPSRATRLVEVTVMVTLAPAASVPAEGVTVMLPASAPPDVTEERTGPPWAVRVTFAVATPLTDTRRSVPVDSASVPGAGGGGAGGEDEGAVAVPVLAGAGGLLAATGVGGAGDREAPGAGVPPFA